MDKYKAGRNLFKINLNLIFLTALREVIFFKKIVHNVSALHSVSIKIQ